MLQYKLKNKLSVERIVKALKTSNCLVEEDGSIYILQNECNRSYNSFSIELNNKNETIEDYINIIESYNVEIPFERYKKVNFDNYLNNIKY